MKSKNSIVSKIIFVTIAVFLVFSAYGQKDKPMNMNMHIMHGAKIDKAICILYPTKDNKVSGKIVFIKVENGIKVIADIEGLTEGKHGFHIHTCGDCSADDGSSAGGHFNPDNKMHGAPTDTTRHVGDMGNIVADNNGKAHLEYIDNFLSFWGPNSIIGRSVIVHKDADDFKTQPTGNSGARVACGVIGIACQ